MATTNDCSPSPFASVLSRDMLDTATLKQEIKRRRTEEHISVFSQSYSEDGKLLGAGSNDGSICIWDIEQALGQEVKLEDRSSPIKTFKAHNNSVYAMATYKDLLITAGGSEIKAWRWTDFTPEQGNNNLWPLNPYSKNDKDTSRFEINSISIDAQRGLFAGCGDNNVYLFDLATGQIARKFQGHEDYVHCVQALPTTSQCVSASEDGSVRIWDCRAKRETTVLWPAESIKTKQSCTNKTSDCSKRQPNPSHSNRNNNNLSSATSWVSSVAVDADANWLACGGGCTGSLWHLRSNTFVTALHSSSGPTQIAEMVFSDGGVVAVGNSATVPEWSFDGTLKRELVTSMSQVFSIAKSSPDPNPIQITSLVGTGRTIELFAGTGQKLSYGLTFETHDSMTSPTR